MAPKRSVARSTTAKGPGEAQGPGTAAVEPANVPWALGARDPPSGNTLQDEIKAHVLTPQDIRVQEAKIAEHMMHERAWIPFEQIQTENGMALGQSRKLDDKRVTQYMAHVMANPKRGPLEDMLAIPTAPTSMCPQYATSRTSFLRPHNCQVGFDVRDIASPLSFLTDGKYIILGGQHISSAYNAIRLRKLAENPDVDLEPRWTGAWGEILRPDTPLEVRRTASRLHNTRQHNSQASTFYDLVRKFAQTAMETEQARALRRLNADTEEDAGPNAVPQRRIPAEAILSPDQVLQAVLDSGYEDAVARSAGESPGGNTYQKKVQEVCNPSSHACASSYAIPRTVLHTSHTFTEPEPNRQVGTPSPIRLGQCASWSVGHCEAPPGSERECRYIQWQGIEGEPGPQNRRSD
jgi:hypothetical protein